MNSTHTYKFALLAGALLFLVMGCGNGPQRSTGIEYAPQMYHSLPYEPFTQVAGVKAPFADSLNAQRPPVGTIAMEGYTYLDYKGTPEFQADERIAAGQDLMNPYEASEEVKEKGKELYVRFCTPCHGPNGMGKGEVPKSENYGPPPAFNKKSAAELPQGEIFYNITYGKNAMGSYAAQLTQDERWMVARYVETMLKSDAPAEEAGEEGVEEAAMEGADEAVAEEGNEEAAQ